MKHLLLALVLATRICSAQVTFSIETTVEFPARYRPEDVQALVQSIDYPKLAQEINATLPGALVENVSLYYQPIVMHPVGGSDRQAVLVLVKGPPGWEREAELKAFLKKYLEKRIAAAN